MILFYHSYAHAVNLIKKNWDCGCCSFFTDPYPNFFYHSYAYAVNLIKKNWDCGCCSFFTDPYPNFFYHSYASHKSDKKN